MRVALYGASDRYNYGDVMMPILFEEWFTKNSTCSIEYINCALIESQMKFCGGLDTCAIGNLPEVDVLVVTGGEVLGTVLSDIACNTFPINQKAQIFIYKVLRRLFPIPFNHWLQFIYRVSSPYLFAQLPSKFITIYNTVGGAMSYRKETTRNDFQKAVSYISEASYVSCRTNFDTEKLKEVCNIDVLCYPDSVILLSQLYPIERLVSLCRESVLNEIKDRYFVFQACSLSKDEVVNVANAINIIYNKFNIKCFLLPIAYAQNHGDVQALKSVRYLCQEASIFPEETTIFETATILANAQAYCGTSLHGVITAISYAVPHCTWRKTHYKTVHFLETWKSTKYIYADKNNVLDILSSLLTDVENKELVKTVRIKLIDLANENYRNINKIFMECESKKQNEKIL